MKNWMLLGLVFSSVAVEGVKTRGENKKIIAMRKAAQKRSACLGVSPATASLLPANVLAAIGHVSERLFLMHNYEVRRAFCGWLSELLRSFEDCVSKDDSHFKKMYGVMKVLYPRLGGALLDVSSDEFRRFLSTTFAEQTLLMGESLFFTDAFGAMFVKMCVSIPLLVISCNQKTSQEQQLLIECLLGSVEFSL